MSDEAKLQIEACRAVLAAWAPGQASNALSATDMWDEVRKIMAEVINRMLTEDPMRFTNALYRLDVSEEKVMKVMKEAPPLEIPYRLADVILQRELQKMQTRAKYSKPSSD